MLLVAATVAGFQVGDYNATGFRLRALQQDLYRMQSSMSVEKDNIQQQKALIKEGYSDLEPIRRSATIHVLLGVLASLVTILVSSIAVTYFIGTNRWCKEVVTAYGMKDDIVQRSNALKRRSFPPALATMLLVLSVAIVGAAADPGTLRANTAEWIIPHRLSSLAGIIAIAFCLWLQVRYLAANHVIIQEVLEKVQRQRRDRGLDVLNEEPLDIVAENTSKV